MFGLGYILQDKSTTMNHSSKYLILRDLELFKAIDDIQIEQLCNQSTFQKIKKGAFLYSVEDPINYVYLIHKGSFKIGMHTGQDKILIKEISYKNEMVGENIFAGHHKRREFAQALEPCEYFRIPSSYFKALLEKNPHLCQQLTQILIHKMAKLEERMNNFVFIFIFLILFSFFFIFQAKCFLFSILCLLQKLLLSTI